ncbi:MAG: J domain-containing protein [Myxococcales bacterium]|nr:J domain-containing protein [Myxococcales bacterium]
MTFDEAMAILGVGVEAGEDGARRAYLRLVRVHKPDRDPEGFRRVREAWERVRPEIAFRAQLFRPAVPSEPPVAGEADAWADEEDDDEDEGDEDDDEAEARPATPDDDRYPPNATRDLPPLTVAQIKPPGPGNPWAESPTPLLAVAERAPLQVHLHPPPRLRMGPAQGHRVRVEERSPAPPPAPAEAPENVRPLGVPWALLESGHQRLRAGEFAGIADVIAAFEEARRRPEAPEPSAATGISVVLLLWSQGRIAAARDVFGRLRAWLTATGAERRLMGGGLAARLAVATGLAALPPESPEAPIRAIARATLDDHLEKAHGDLRTFARESPYSAGISAADFQRCAPLLAGMFADSLQSQPVHGFSVPQPKKKSRAPIFSIGLLVMLGALFLARIGGDSRRAPAYTYRPPPIDFKMAPLTLPRLDFKAPRVDLQVIMLQRYVLDICEEDLESEAAPCRLARAIHEAASKHDCAAVEAGVAALEATGPPRPRGQPTNLKYRLLALTARRRCALPSSGTVEPVDAGADVGHDNDAGPGP